ncbi:Co-chaperone Hsc20, partial [Amniculicola lignicola CBS 123094]
TSRAPTRRFQSTSSASASPNNREDTRPPSQTHYSFFPQSLPAGPPPHGRFTVDLTSLKREFLQLQGRAHPDLHPQSDKNRAQALSARINEAYKTLQSPLLRAQYLLSLRGIDTHEDETAKVEDPELLMEVLEAREQIEEAQSEEDLVEMKVENEARIAESVGILEEAFEKDDVDTAKKEAVKLRYWVNIKESLHGWERGKPVVLEH